MQSAERGITLTSIAVIEYSKETINDKRWGSSR
jgi:hypothetical protein